jgi:hypothetical protein
MSEIMNMKMKPALPQERLENWRLLQFLEKEILKDDYRGQRIKGVIRIDNENEGEQLPSLERIQVMLEELASDGILEYKENEEKFNLGIYWYDIVICQPQFRRLYDELFQNFQETKSLLLLHFQKYGQELFPHYKKSDFVSKKDLEIIMETARQSAKSPSNFFFSINDYVDALYNSTNGYKITQGFLNDEGKALFKVFYEAREKVYEDCMHLHTFFQKLLKKLQKGKFGDDITDAFAEKIQEWISEVNISHHCSKKECIDVLSMALELEDLLAFIFSYEEIRSEESEKMKKEIQKALEKIGFFVIGSVSSLKEAFSQSLTSSGEESKTYVMPSVLPVMNKYDDFSDREFFQNTFILSLNHYRKILHTLVESSKNSRWSAWENLFLVFALLKMKTFPDSYFEDSGIRSKISIPEGQSPNLKILRRDFAILMDSKKQDLFTKAFEIDEYMRHLQKVHFYVCSQLEEETEEVSIKAIKSKKTDAFSEQQNIIYQNVRNRGMNYLDFWELIWKNSKKISDKKKEEIESNLKNFQSVNGRDWASKYIGRKMKEPTYKKFKNDFLQKVRKICPKEEEKIINNLPDSDTTVTK